MLSVLIITKNEEIHLGRLIKNVKDLADEIIILDSFSSDQTIEIAKRENCTVFQNEFKNFSSQRNYLFKNCKIKNEWSLILDADEYLSNDLKNEIKQTIRNTKFDAFKFKRRLIWKNKWIKRGYYPIWLLRLGRTKTLFCDENIVNEHIQCKTNKVSDLKNDFFNHNLKNEKEWFKKHLIYAEFEKNRYFIKNEITKKRILWNKIPIILRPFLLFFYRFFIQLIFLDGLRGFQYHLYHSLIYKLIIDYKILIAVIKNEKFNTKS